MKKKIAITVGLTLSAGALWASATSPMPVIRPAAIALTIRPAFAPKVSVPVSRRSDLETLVRTQSLVLRQA